MLKKSMYSILALLVLSMLPGCGKSSDSGVATYGVYGASVLSGSCYNLNTWYQSNPNATFQGSFAGNQGYVYASAINVVMYGSQTGVSGTTYGRSNSYGDSITIGINGNVATSVVTLAPATVAAVVYYYGGVVCGVYANSAFAGNTLTTSVKLVGANGTIPLSI